MRRRLPILSTCVLGIGLSGCWPAKKKPLVPVPPPPIPAQAPAEKQPEAAKPETPKPDVPKPAPPAPRRAVPAPAPAPTPAPTIAPAPPPPALGEILTDARKREIENDLAQNISRARAALARTSGHSLTASQRETVDRIRTFIQQSEQSKARDLSTSLQLARRAALLGDDLVKSLQ